MNAKGPSRNRKDKKEKPKRVWKKRGENARGKKDSRGNFWGEEEVTD